jgi:hypothetical protein
MGRSAAQATAKPCDKARCFSGQQSVCHRPSRRCNARSGYKIARSTPGCSFWCVYGKGKFATISDGDIRAYLRAQRYVDNKTTAVSERLTATRYSRKAQT